VAKARGKGGGGGAQTAQPPDAPIPPQPAQHALARGDVKTARRLAAQDLTSSNEANRELARRVFEETRPDPAALIAAAAVLLVILLAAWLALFRSH